MHLTLENAPQPSGDELPVEIVERKGLGHPDTICDLIADRLSNALSRHYIDRYGLILHHNVDKALLWAGAARPAFGGGEIIEPMELFLAGRATTEVNADRVPIGDIADTVVGDWLEDKIPWLKVKSDFKVHKLIRPASAELVALFEKQVKFGVPLANDTSCGVGFAPQSTLERIVTAVERRLNDPRTKVEHPALGSDIKVMGLRRDDTIDLTIACAMIDQHLESMDGYIDNRDRAGVIAIEEASRFTTLPVAVSVNTGDNISAGEIYLTVTGTSAEAGDDGQAGRGNRANGLITPFRPMTIESVAGKNPVTHVGKLYSVAAERMSQSLCSEIDPVSNVECYLVSEIGRPVREPKLVNIRVETMEGLPVADLREDIEAVVADHLAGLDRLWESLTEEELGY